MKLVAFAAACALALAVTMPAVAQEDGKIYGKGLTDATEVKLVELVAHPDKYVGKTVRVAGTITDVCPMKGCWMDLTADSKSDTVRIKVDDGVMVFPKEAKGSQAIAEGVFTKVEMTKDQAMAHAKHLADERGDKMDAATAGDVPTVIYQIKGTGVVIK